MFSIRWWSWQRFGALLASFLVVLGASWRLFGCSWGVLGTSRWLPSYFNNHSGALLSHQSGPQSLVKGPQQPSKRARWPQDAIKIHAKTSSKQFSFDFVSFRASKLSNLLPNMKDCKVCTTDLLQWRTVGLLWINLLCKNYHELSFISGMKLFGKH